MKPIIYSAIIYWTGMWLSLFVLMLISGGTHAIAFEPVYTIILYHLLISLVLLPLVIFVWSVIVRRYKNKKYAALLLWNLLLWIIITAICEWGFNVLSGNVHGLGSFRNGWYSLLALSTLWVSVAYWYAANKLNR